MPSIGAVMVVLDRVSRAAATFEEAHIPELANGAKQEDNARGNRRPMHQRTGPGWHNELPARRGDEGGNEQQSRDEQSRRTRWREQWLPVDFWNGAATRG